MKNKTFLLLSGMLKNSSRINIFKHTDDKKKRSNIVGTYIGESILFICLMGYCGLQAIGLGMFGLAEAIPTVTVVLVSLLSLIFTIFKVNGYLFAFKDYDMLMALPFTVKTVVSSKFLYMYVKSSTWFISIIVAMLAGYAYFERPAWYIYILWLAMGVLLPVIPMLAATLIGALIAKVGSGFKKKKTVEIILTFIVVIPIFFSRFIIEKIFKEEGLEHVVDVSADFFNSSANWYMPSRWFREAVNDGNIVSFLLFVVVTLVLFEIFFLLLSKNYREINSKLMTYSKAEKKEKCKSTSDNAYKKKNIVTSIVMKEFKCLMGSTVFATNAVMGEVMALILGIAVIFVNVDKLIATVFEGAPITKEMLIPAVPFIIYFMVGMVPASEPSPSLEGKNLWILKSLPIQKMDICKGKMIFNMLLALPVGIFACMTCFISAKAGVIDTLAGILEITVLCLLSTVFGLRCGLKHINTEWENEVEVVKQGAAVTSYLLPNMITTMILLVVSVVAGKVLTPALISLIVIVVCSVLTALSFEGVKKYMNAL